MPVICLQIPVVLWHNDNINHLTIPYLEWTFIGINSFSREIAICIKHYGNSHLTNVLNLLIFDQTFQQKESDKCKSISCEQCLWRKTNNISMKEKFGPMFPISLLCFRTMSTLDCLWFQPICRKLICSIITFSRKSILIAKCGIISLSLCRLHCLTTNTPSFKINENLPDQNFKISPLYIRYLINFLQALFYWNPITWLTRTLFYLQMISCYLTGSIQNKN